MENIVHVMDCPGCPTGQGEVAISMTISTAMLIERRKAGDAKPPTPSSPRILFNPGDGDSKPCMHLLQVVGHCQLFWLPKQNPPEPLWTEFSWNHRLFKSAKLLERKWLYQRSSHDYSSPLLLSSEFFNHRYEVRYDENLKYAFEVYGRVLFSSDVKSLIGKLRKDVKFPSNPAEEAA